MKIVEYGTYCYDQIEERAMYDLKSVGNTKNTVPGATASYGLKEKKIKFFPC